MVNVYLAECTIGWMYTLDTSLWLFDMNEILQSYWCCLNEIRNYWFCLNNISGFYWLFSLVRSWNWIRNHRLW